MFVPLLFSCSPNSKHLLFWIQSQHVVLLLLDATRHRLLMVVVSVSDREIDRACSSVLMQLRNCSSPMSSENLSQLGGLVNNNVGAKWILSSGRRLLWKCVKAKKEKECEVWSFRKLLIINKRGERKWKWMWENAFFLSSLRASCRDPELKSPLPFLDKFVLFCFYFLQALPFQCIDHYIIYKNCPFGKATWVVRQTRSSH